MQEVYVQPELKLAGEATEIVKGNLGPGVDFDNMMLVTDFEFQED